MLFYGQWTMHCNMTAKDKLDFVKFVYKISGNDCFAQFH